MNFFLKNSIRLSCSKFQRLLNEPKMKFLFYVQGVENIFLRDLTVFYVDF
ncbi:unnamed protein product [Meloidogyne enterolobii]|uniref:Uncharacterized protein n=1 Tax=Meloidogyne enterolobii TaxID=390850 RepID=A0ACB0ZEC6_MELEN